MVFSVIEEVGIGGEDNRSQAKGGNAGDQRLSFSTEAIFKTADSQGAGRAEPVSWGRS